jgi:hypothetical protein
MPITIALDEQATLLRVVASGNVDCDEALRGVRSSAALLAGRGWGALVDVRAREYIPSVADLRQIAFEISRLRTAFGGGVAFVVATEVHYRLGRFLAALTEPRGLRMGVERSVDDALRWLAAA